MGSQVESTENWWLWKKWFSQMFPDPSILSQGEHTVNHSKPYGGKNMVSCSPLFNLLSALFESKWLATNAFHWITRYHNALLVWFKCFFTMIRLWYIVCPSTTGRLCFRPSLGESPHPWKIGVAMVKVADRERPWAQFTITSCHLVVGEIMVPRCFSWNVLNLPSGKLT